MFLDEPTTGLDAFMSEQVGAGSLLNCMWGWITFELYAVCS